MAEKVVPAYLKYFLIIYHFQAVLLKDAMHIHRERVSDDLKPFHAHLEDRFSSWIKMIESEYKLQVSLDNFMAYLCGYKQVLIKK